MLAMPAEPTVLARLAGPLMTLCGELGGAALASELAERFGLAPTLLDDPDARIPLARFHDLLELALDRTGEPSLGQRYSDDLDPRTMGLLGFLAATAADFGVVVDRMIRHQRLISEGERMSIARAGERVIVEIHPWGPTRPAHRIWTEAAFVDLIANGRRLVGERFEVHEVRLRHARHPGAEALAERLACPLRFDAEDYAAELPASALALPIAGADPAMFEFFDREAARRSEALDEAHDWLAAVRRAIEHALPEGVPTLEHLAERMRVSPRTLQRRLHDRGSSLRELVDELRSTLARRHLAAGLSIAEVSFLLGFSEPSAFHRAFRRWLGVTPVEWRARRHDDG
ncbi:AraC family transcriptional regulator [Nannocystaceae bacterium ST9]